MAVQVPRSARLCLPAPMFWLTKVVDAMAMLCMGSMMNWSSLLYVLQPAMQADPNTFT